MILLMLYREHLVSTGWNHGSGVGSSQRCLALARQAKIIPAT